LTEICDPVYLLGLLRASLGRYIYTQQDVETNGNGEAHRSFKVQANGYLFGFNGMGMCILRLPPPVIEVEAPKLASIVTEVSSSFFAITEKLTTGDEQCIH
jgi:CLIP-associating protein 1/2